MKTKHLIAESILVFITLLFGIGMIFSEDMGFGFLVWLQFLGFSQVVHSILIGVFYWNHTAIKNCILVYWAGVAFDFILMYANAVTIHDHDIAWFTLPVFPLVLAAYLWFITWHFRRRGNDQQRLHDAAKRLV